MYFRVKNTLKNNIYYTLKHSFQQLFYFYFSLVLVYLEYLLGFYYLTFKIK
jgi:hypothetical protein